MQSADNLVWMDLEMTGLSVATETIMEVATIITDSQLNVIAEGPEIAIHLSDEVLAGMDEWCLKTHGASGLIERCRQSSISIEQATEMTLAFVQQYVPAKSSPLCGNSICQDRKFIEKYMPALDSYLHYRLLDVSSFKEAARRWNKPVFDAVQKKGTHTALSDIHESIAEMRHYRHKFIIGA
jgi:oligoribonuclease